MTIQLAYKQLIAKLYSVYDDREAANIADWVIENITGQNKINRILYKELPVSKEQQQRLKSVTTQLEAQKPIQYVLNECWFAGMKLYVDENVLIPRPETEELVEWITASYQTKDYKKAEALSILDVGTGSGCIPITLKKSMPYSMVTGVDISIKALEVARKNALDQQVDIQFIEVDFLQQGKWEKLGNFNVIVSNPPYIKKSEAALMSANVLQYEPNIALFVPDDDAFIFYNALAEFASQHLLPGGAVFVEINEALGAGTKDVFARNGFTNIELRKDLQGKDRMIKAER